MPRLARKIKELSKKHSRIAFLVITPNSTNGDPVQSPMLTNFCVKTTNDGTQVVVGRDRVKEIKKDMIDGREYQPGQKRRKSHMVFRQYRVDRIIPRTIISS